ncbi:hypothetical protein BASA83_009595 [Batrachochytrium salamandrivorans]|nr:hypothetical protein BASA83_009595 [Batrachochytrium salamandrivorans]
MTERKAFNKLRDKLSHFRSSPYAFGTLKRTSIRYSNPSLVVRSGRQQNPVVKSNTMKRWQPIAEINCDAAEYLKNSDSKRWARSHFSVPRFGTVTLNSAESLNSWMKEYRDKSHLGILTFWVSHSARLLYSRKQEYANADTVLSPRSFRTFNQKP